MNFRKFVFFRHCRFISRGRSRARDRAKLREIPPRILGCVHGGCEFGTQLQGGLARNFALLVKSRNCKVNFPLRKEVNGARRLRNPGSRPIALRRIRASEVQWSNVKSGVYLYTCKRKKEKERRRWARVTRASARAE